MAKFCIKKPVSNQPGSSDKKYLIQMTDRQVSEVFRVLRRSTRFVEPAPFMKSLYQQLEAVTGMSGVLRYPKKKNEVNVVLSAKKTSGKERVKIGDALQRSADFFGFRPRRIRAVKLEWPKAVVDAGMCTQVNYVNDKHDGKVREYYHKFQKPPRVFFADKTQRDGSEMIIIVGHFKIKPEGIVG